MSLKVTTKQINPGWAKRIAKNIEGLAKKEVAVGFPVGGRGKSVTYDNGASVLDVAVWNNFGVPGHIPARPFMDEANERIVADAKGSMEEIAKKANRREITAAQALNGIALFGESAVKESITDGTYEPNAPSTVRAKKSSKPLINKGKMRQTVGSVVRNRID